MKVTGIILVIVGVLAVIAGFVAPVVGATASISTVNTTDSTTYGKGELVKVLNPGKLVANPSNPYDENVQFSNVRVTKADTEAMEQQDAKDEGATVFVTDSTTTRDDTGEELSVTKATFAFNADDQRAHQLLRCQPRRQHQRRLPGRHAAEVPLRFAAGHGAVVQLDACRRRSRPSSRKRFRSTT